MLTIREPIALKTQNPIQGIRQDMAERMQANYGLMNMSIRKEELLHITSESPEVYFAEGDSLQVFNNIQTQNQQEIRLDVINNLLNRIMVSQTENFTYQDTVYISSVLRRLGIRDEKTFMKQVFALQNEHKETRQLLQKYEENQEILQKLFMENNAQPKSEAEKAAEVSERERRYYIHDEIFQRLETGKVYQDIRHYSKGTRHESQQIFRTEMSVGEQTSQVQNFMLHTLKQRITNNETPFYYYHNNRYEFLQELTENIEESLEEQMSAAILLNIADQSYTLRQEQIEQNSHNWYSLAGALFQTAENTWKRYEANLLERKFLTNDMLQVLEEVTERKHVEGDTISSIAEEYKKIDQQWNNTLENQTFLLHHSVQEGKQEKINITGGSYHLTQEELELNFLTQEQEENEKEPETITIEQLQKQLEVFNQQNYENYKKITQIEKTQPRVKNRTLDRKKAQKDALRALENPTEVLREYLTTEIHDPVREAQKQVETQIYELFSDDTKEIYRQFLRQNTSTDTTFLQHIMDQPEENEVRQEVLHTLEHVEHEEVIRQLRQEIERNIASARTQVEVEQLQKQLDILNRSDYENYRKILEIERLEADRKAGKAGEGRRFQEPSIIHENLHEVFRENTITEGSSFFTETEKELEKQMYHLFSEKTKNVYEQYYLQNKNTEISFLQHVMNEEEESEVRQEVLQTLEHVEHEEVIRQLRQEIERNIEYARTEVEVEHLQKQLDILNRKDFENYQKILEIERLEADRKAGKAREERRFQEPSIIHENLHEVFSENTITGENSFFTETEKELEKQMYHLFSKKTKNVYEQYYLQNKNTEISFLQHVMNEEEESEVRQEVLQTLEHVEHEEVIRQLRQEIERNIAYARTQVEVEQLQKQLDILNRKDYENYRKILEIGRLQADTVGRKAAGESFSNAPQIVHESIDERLQEYMTAEREHLFTEIEKEIEKQFYGRFSEKTTNVLEQYYLQNEKTETPFLQHMINQVEESEAWQEVLQTLEHAEQERVLQQLRQELERNIETVRTETETGQIQKQLEILNRRDYETYQKIAEIEKLQAAAKGGKTVTERPLETVSMIHEKTSEVLREYITAKANSIFTQIEKEVEKQLYDRFSKKTKTVYQQFLTESREPEQTFIQYLLEQPQESEPRQEMIQALQTIEYREIMQKLQNHVQQNNQYVQRSVSQNINKEIRQQLNTWNNLQASTLYEQWTLPAEIFWQREKEKETLLDQQITTQQEILQAKGASMVKAPGGSMPQEERLPQEKQALVHPVEQVETEEIYQQNEQRDILHMQETRLMDVRQNIEKQIVLQQAKASVKFMAEQKEMQFKTIDFVHKTEEQLINEELLEEIRMQKQNTKREEHTENQTVENSRSINQTVQETINHVQTSRIEDIEQIVQQSVKKQLNNLSDQVYGKIEKKLQTERKRRGYF